MCSWDELYGQPLDERTTKVIPFFEEQCESLSEWSQGSVKARVAEIKIKIPAPTGMRGLIEGYARSLQSGIPEDSIDEEPLGLMDAGELYSPKRYGFDVYNDKYEFRPFVAKVGAVYPITLTIDETIASETRGPLSNWLNDDDKANVMLIQSDDDLADCFRVIMSSRKMRFVMNMLKDGC